MYSNRILINAANIHAGGAIQVATSFIEELVKLNDLNYNIVASSELNNELIQLNIDFNLFSSYSVYDVFGLRALVDFKFIRLLLSYEIVFTIFGPLYSWKKPKKSVVGFAQPWIIYPNNEIYANYSLKNKLQSRIKYFLQSYFFYRDDKIIVELEHVKSELCKHKACDNIHIVYNCVSSIFNNKERWAEIEYSSINNELTLGILSRDYPHKNLNILMSVGEVLQKDYNVQIKFLVTLTPEEWSLRGSEFYKFVDNIGKLDIPQCPSFYGLLDGVIFPSLLECFSATPIEAMIMKKPVFASDRPFVRQVCGEDAFYFNPNNAHDIASKIYKYYYEKDINNNSFLDNAYIKAMKYNNPSHRAKKYIDILKQC